MTTSKLFDPYQLGPLTLPNRVVMAPLTRNRAVAGMDLAYRVGGAHAFALIGGLVGHAVSFPGPGDRFSGR